MRHALTNKRDFRKSLKQASQETETERPSVNRKTNFEKSPEGSAQEGIAYADEFSPNVCTGGPIYPTYGVLASSFLSSQLPEVTIAAARSAT